MRFRTMSVAASTVNRILNIADQIEPAVPQPKPAPAVPAPDGIALDAALKTPAPPVAGDPMLGQAVVADGLGLDDVS